MRRGEIVSLEQSVNEIGLTHAQDTTGTIIGKLNAKENLGHSTVRDNETFSHLRHEGTRGIVCVRHTKYVVHIDA